MTLQILPQLQKSLLVCREPVQAAKPVLSQYCNIIEMDLEMGFLVKSNGEVTLNAYCQDRLSQGH